MYPNWDFWFENKSSGNPGRQPHKQVNPVFGGKKQGCQIFRDTTYQNGGKMHQISANIPNGPKISPVPYNRPHGHKHTNIFFPLQDPPRFTQFGILV
jgi:hypothetical protein